MKRFLFFSSTILALALLFQSCINLNKIKGNKDIVSKEYKISDYTSLKAEGKVEIIYEQSEGTPYLRIETDSNLFDYIDVDSDESSSELEIDVDDDVRPTTLKVYTNSSSLLNVQLSGASQFNIEDFIRTTKLSIFCSGASKTTINKIDAQALDIRTSGSSSIFFHNVQTQKFSLRGSGATKIELAGQASDAKYVISGSGKILAPNLETQNSQCTISGSGSAILNCMKNLDVTISGSGKIQYKGDAQVSQKVSGSGKIEKI